MERSIQRWLLAIAAVGFAAVAAYIGWFVGHLGKSLSDDPGVWGQFGDYVGGFLNPLIAGAALYWLTQSVRIQHRELTATKTELAKAASSQAAQVRLAALSAELTAVSAAFGALSEDITQFRGLQQFVVRQMTRDAIRTIRGVDGKVMTTEQALRALEQLEESLRETMQARVRLMNRINDLGTQVANVQGELGMHL